MNATTQRRGSHRDTETQRPGRTSNGSRGISFLDRVCAKHVVRRVTPPCLCVSVALLFFGFFPFNASAATPTVIRANQIGYLPDDPKIAILSSSEPLSGQFNVGDNFIADVG